MSESERRNNGPHHGNTLDIDDFEPISEELPEEYDPQAEDYEADYEDDWDDDMEYIRPVSAAEKALSIATLVLSVLLLIGSAVFWWYFVSRLCICPVSVSNRRLYPAMLITCAAVSLAVTIARIMRRRRPSPEGWMINICISGVITTIIMIIFNTVTLGNAFEWGDVLPSLCFTVSGCALPAAIYAVVWVLVLLFIAHIRRENSKDKAVLYADVSAQCGCRF